MGLGQVNELTNQIDHVNQKNCVELCSDKNHDGTFILL